MDPTPQDAEHLRLLSIFHYVVAGLAFLFGCFPIIHLVIGILIVANPGAFQDGRGQGPPAFMGWFFVLFAGAMILGAWTLASCLLAAGRCLSRRTRHTFCFAVACISCVFMPFGTALGVFTIIVLLRPSVKDAFGAA